MSQGKTLLGAKCKKMSTPVIFAKEKGRERKDKKEFPVEVGTVDSS